GSAPLASAPPVGMLPPALPTAVAPGAPPTSAAAPPLAPLKKKMTTPEPKDSPREIVETIVFVVVLVLLLKTFLAEAFVIPTGSMAETLYGYQKNVTCEQCGFQFPVNCASEVEGQNGVKIPVTSCECPNCRF